MERGVLLLGVYSLGLAIPFFVSSLTVPAFLQLFGRVAAYLRAIEVGGGVLMIPTSYVSAPVIVSSQMAIIALVH